MASHFWLIPWLALAAGLTAAVSGLFRVRLNRARSIPPGLVALWILLLAGCGYVLYRRGQSTGAEYVAVRGVLLGALGGLAITLARPPRGPHDAGDLYEAPLLFGVWTAIASIGRLWLTHAEASGLTALLLGGLLTVLCLSVAPSNTVPGDRARDELPCCDTPATSLIYLATLIGSMELGFTRADHLKEMIWADLTLLIGAAICLGLLVNAISGQALSLRRWAAAPGLILSMAAAVLASHSLVQSWKPAETVILGILAIGLVLLVRSKSSAVDPTDHAAAGPLLVLLLVISLTFAIGAGYGMGLMAVGAWMAAAWPLLVEDDQDNRYGSTAPAALTFLALLLLHRLLLLQPGVGANSSSPANTWDLLGIVLGVLLPLTARGWIERGERNESTPKSQLTTIYNIVEWILLLVGAPLLVVYLLGGRSVAGVVLGLGIAQLAAAFFQRFDVRRMGVAALFSGSVLLVGGPWIHELAAPTHHRRMLVVSVIAALLWLRAAGPALGSMRLRK